MLGIVFIHIKPLSFNRLNEVQIYCLILPYFTINFFLIFLIPATFYYYYAPYEDSKFEEAIGDLWEVMNKYNPEICGFKWADEDGPRFQLSPMGY
ncbi:MAG: hypothetical protein ACOWWR_14250, partial [Eubacteriales bacterium]